MTFFLRQLWHQSDDLFCLQGSADNRTCIRTMHTCIIISIQEHSFPLFLSIFISLLDHESIVWCVAFPLYYIKVVHVSCALNSPPKFCSVRIFQSLDPCVVLLILTSIVCQIYCFWLALFASSNFSTMSMFLFVFFYQKVQLVRPSALVCFIRYIYTFTFESTLPK